MPFTKSWWTTVAWPLVRTALAGVAPFIPALVEDPVGAWRGATLTVGLAVVAALAMALVSLPDASESWWENILRRVLRQFGQMIVAATASAALLTDVDWRSVLTVALGSALTTLVLAALGQPQAGDLEFAEVAAFNFIPDASSGLRGGLTDLEQHADAVAALYDPTPGVFNPRVGFVPDLSAEERKHLKGLLEDFEAVDATAGGPGGDPITTGLRKVLGLG